MHFSNLRYLVYGILLSVSVSSLVVSAGSEDGVFGDYFTRMIGLCPDNSVVTGFSTTPTNYGTRQCKTISELIGSVFGSDTAPARQAVVGFNPNGTLKYGDVGAFTRVGDNITYTGGNVGIGTISPTFPLHIYSTANSPTQIFLENNNGSSDVYGDTGIRMKTRNSDYRIFANDESNLLLFWDNTVSQARMILDGNGNVGIGTSSPSNKLEVAGGHGDTKFRLYSIGNGLILNSSLDMWASEPGVTYDGAGIGNNVNGHPYYGRRNNNLGQSYIRFYQGNTYFANGVGNASTKMTLSNDGDVSIGADPWDGLGWAGSLYVNGSVRGARYYDDDVNYYIDSNTTSIMHTIRANGDITSNGSFIYSDRRLKENIVPLDNSLDKILSLTGYSFDLKHGGKHSLGIIAQEVEEIFPELVNTNPQTQMKSVEYSNLVAPLIEAIKEQQTMIENQQHQINHLYSEIQKIKK